MIFLMRDSGQPRRSMAAVRFGKRPRRALPPHPKHLDAKGVHSEIGLKLLTDLGADFYVFSEQALILQGNLSDLIPPCGGSNPPAPAT